MQGATPARLPLVQVIGTSVILLMLGIAAVSLFWLGFSESRAGLLFAGLFLVVLMAYTIVHTTKAARRAKKQVPVDQARELRALTLWLRFAAATSVALLAYNAWISGPVSTYFVLILGLAGVVGWLIVIRKATRT